MHQFNVLAEHRRLKIEAESVVLAHDGAGAIEDRRRRLLNSIRAATSWTRNISISWRPLVTCPISASCAISSKRAENASDGTVAGFAQAASHLIHERFRYVKGATHVHSSIEDSLSIGAGVCQDFAHVLLGVVRMRGLPARYVSGYLVPGDTAAPDAKQEEVIGGQASHAWTEVLMPEAGWTGFDPTLGDPVGLRHVRVAYGRDYGDVAPVRGVYKGRAGQRLSVDVCVRPAIDDSGTEQLSENHVESAARLLRTSSDLSNPPNSRNSSNNNNSDEGRSLSHIRFPNRAARIQQVSIGCI